MGGDHDLVVGPVRLDLDVLLGCEQRPGLGALSRGHPPGRIRSQAALTSLAGVNPIPARPATPFATASIAVATDVSTALHMAVATRLRTDHETRA